MRMLTAEDGGTFTLLDPNGWTYGIPDFGVLPASMGATSRVALAVRVLWLPDVTAVVYDVIIDRLGLRDHD